MYTAYLDRRKMQICAGGQKVPILNTILPRLGEGDAGVPKLWSKPVCTLKHAFMEWSLGLAQKKKSQG